MRSVRISKTYGQALSQRARFFTRAHAARRDWESKLEEHARLEEREPVSRFPFKSPCWASWEIDFAVHVVLARMVEEKYPEMAERLRNASPRWGWRARARRQIPRAHTPD